MQENNEKSGSQQIAGAIIIAGIIIAGAILLKGNTAPTANASIAKTIGLNIKTFDACVESGKFKNKVQADINDGSQAGVTGTPYSFIVKDGIVVDSIGGAQPFEKVIQQIDDVWTNEKTETTITQIKPVTSADHIVGSTNAKIIIVEYSDLDCPFCKTFHNTMHEVVKEYPRGDSDDGEVAWVYRHFPLTQIHPDAFQKAIQTECAWDQKGNDGFWKYTDALFGITQK